MDQIEEIKEKTDIVSLISEYVPLKKAGRNFRACCPFHSEKTPSFMVSSELQIFKCFGCGQSGDAIKFLQLYEKMDFWEAIELLAKRVGMTLVHRQVTREEGVKKRLYEINHLAAEFYHYLLLKHKVGKKALDYILGRGIKKETLETFGIGFSPLRSGAVAAFLKKKGYEISEVLNAGLIVSVGQNNFLDRFHSRLIFPLLDHRENVVGFSGRSIPDISPPEFAKYINTPDTLIYHKSENLYGLWLTKNEIAKKGEAIVVEGELDLISPYQEGIKNIVAIKGTAFTEGQAKLVARFAETAILALDTDAAGLEAVKRSAQVSNTANLNVKVVKIPPGFKDPDEIARQRPELLKSIFEEAFPIWDFLIESLGKKYLLKDPFEKKKFFGELMPFLIGIESEVVKDFYFKKLSALADVSLESILIEAEKMKKGGKAIFEKSVEPHLANRRPLLEKHLLGLIFLKRSWKWFKDKNLVDFIASPAVKRIFDLARQSFKKKKKFSVKRFFSSLPDELKPVFEEIYFLQKKEHSLRRKEKVVGVFNELKSMEFHRRFSEISSQIAQAEKAKDKKRLLSLEKEFVDVSRKLTEIEQR